jgi:hypothetical protein
MPSPQKNETQDDFISRCMTDPEMKSEFPNSEQRKAVCYSYWDDKKKDEKD